MMAKMLNIGCGSHYHPDWINLDVAPSDPQVLSIDVNRGLPFPADSVDVCYSSHVLEHLNKQGAQYFVSDCFRVLKPGGVIRLVMPDIETLTREYLRVLDAVIAGDDSRAGDYDWLMLELYDQTVRTSPGGEMATFLQNLPEKQRAFVRSRIGVEAEQFWRPQSANVRVGLTKDRVKKTFQRLRVKIAEYLVCLIAGRSAANSFRTGIFRNSGEIHQWMYDRYSLTRLLANSGFVDLKICAADESRIAEYGTYSLDVLNGAIRKPDSLYIEAIKP